MDDIKNCESSGDGYCSEQHAMNEETIKSIYTLNAFFPESR